MWTCNPLLFVVAKPQYLINFLIGCLLFFLLLLQFLLLFLFLLSAVVFCPLDEDLVVGVLHCILSKIVVYELCQLVNILFIELGLELDSAYGIWSIYITVIPTPRLPKFLQSLLDLQLFYLLRI